MATRKLPTSLYTRGAYGYGKDSESQQSTMSEPLAIPVLGFGDESTNSYTVKWRSGDVVYVGLLGDIEELLAQHHARKAEEANKQELRDNGVAVLEDWRNK